LSTSCQQVVNKLSTSCQKVVKVIKKLSQIALHLVKSSIKKSQSSVEEEEEEEEEEDNWYSLDQVPTTSQLVKTDPGITWKENTTVFSFKNAAVPRPRTFVYESKKKYVYQRLTYNYYSFVHKLPQLLVNAGK
jgi:hypothetical protein